MVEQVAMLIAYWRVRLGHAQRIAAPGKWKVWRDADGVHAQVQP